jgi:threonine/homoserine/homoserine lactone efflux protein
VKHATVLDDGLILSRGTRGLVALPSCLPWLAFGAALRRFLRTPRAWRILNGAMALLLAASTIPLLWTRL